MTNWPVVKLNHCFNLIGSGTTPSTSSSKFYDGEIPWITTSELRETVIEETQKHVSKDAFDEHSALKLYPKGSLAIAMYGATIGRLGIFGIPATVNQACCVFAEPIDTDIKFIYYYLQAAKEELLLSARGGGQPNLSQDDLRQLRLSLPPLPTQRAIANYLDARTARIDALIAHKQHLLTLLAERRAALITRAVTRGLDEKVALKPSGVDWLGEIPLGWEVKRLKQISSIRGRIGFRGYSSEDLNREGEGALTLGATHVSKNGDIDLSQSVYISWEKYEESPEIMVKEKDIIVVQRGSVGLIGYIKNNIGPATINPSLIIARCEVKEVIAKWVFYTLLSDFTSKVISMLLNATAVPMISQRQTGEFNIVIPPKHEQEAILNILENELDHNARINLKTQISLNYLQEYRSALITAAVNGEVELPAA